MQAMGGQKNTKKYHYSMGKLLDKKHCHSAYEKRAAKITAFFIHAELGGNKKRKKSIEGKFRRSDRSIKNRDLKKCSITPNARSRSKNVLVQ